MASGYGLHGGPSRCFPFWQELLACYVVNSDSEDESGKKKCLPVLEDYYECLHHKKEAYRTQQLQLAYRRAEVEHPREKEPRVGAIRNLGLIEFKSKKISNAEDTKSVLEASQSSK